MHAVNFMAWITRPDAKQFSISITIENGNFSTEVGQDCLDDSLAGLPLTHALACVFELPQMLGRYRGTIWHASRRVRLHMRPVKLREAISSQCSDQLADLSTIIVTLWLPGAPSDGANVFVRSDLTSSNGQFSSTTYRPADTLSQPGRNSNMDSIW
jgi:hypothetical protein